MSRYVVRVVERDGVERYAMLGRLTDSQENATRFPHPSNAWQAADRMLAKFSLNGPAVYIDVIDTRDPERTVMRP
jgi:hypothetical protein